MLDSDLGALYEVPTKALNQAVRAQPRTVSRRFRVCQNGTPPPAIRLHPGRRDDAIGGFAQFSHAVRMSIFIIRAFIRLREIIATNKDIAARVEKLERSRDLTASVIEVLVEDIDRLAREVKDIKALPPTTNGALDSLSAAIDQLIRHQTRL